MADESPQELPIHRLTLDPNVQGRVELDEDLIEEYADNMREGVQFPACFAVHKGGVYWLVNGFHRIGAAKRLGLKTFLVEVVEGTYRDAQLLAMKANHDHGKRLTRADKRYNFDRFMADETWREWPDTEIAAVIGVNQPTIGRWRRELDIVPETVVVTRGSATYRQVRKQPAPPLPPEQAAEAQQMIEDGDAADLDDALAKIKLCDLVDAGEPVVEKYTDTAQLQKRHSRAAGPGEWALLTDIDARGKMFIEDLLQRRRMYCPTPDSPRHTLPEQTGELVRTVLREAWERDVRHEMKEKTAQDAVAKNGKDDGDMAREAYAARELCDCLACMAAMGECWVLPAEFRNLLHMTSNRAQELYDNKELWTQAGGARLRPRQETTVLKRAAALIAPLFKLADALGFDIAAAAVALSATPLP